MANVKVYNNLLMKSGCLILDNFDTFPTSPSDGVIAFKEGVLYIYSTINDVSTWYPLTNKSAQYVHTQGILSTSWTIYHNLNTENLIIFVYDDTDTPQYYSDVQFVNNNQLILTFADNVKGRAVIFGAANAYAPSVIADVIHGQTVIADSELILGGTSIGPTINAISTKLDAMFDWDSVNDDIIFKADLIPQTTETYSIGSATKKIKDLYVSANTVHIGDNTTFAGTAVTVDAGLNPTSEADTPTLSASAIIAKPFTYNPGTGDVVVRPKIMFQDTLGLNYPISFDTVNNKFSFDANGNYGQGNIVAAGAEFSDSIFTTGTLDVDGAVQFESTLRVDGNVNLGYDSNNIVTIKGTPVFETPVAFGDDATLGDGNDDIHINSGAANDFTIDAANITLTETVLTAQNIVAGGNVTISGDLTISGTATTVNSTELTVADNVIELNSGETGTGVTNGTAGIEIDRGVSESAKLYFNEVNDNWYFGIGSNVKVITPSDHTHEADYLSKTASTAPTTDGTNDLGNAAKRFNDVHAISFKGELAGNSETATKLTTPRSITLSGDASGAINFDGTANVTIPVVVADDSHTHDNDYFSKTITDGRYLRRDANAIPTLDNSFDLGENSHRFRNIYAVAFKGNSDTATRLLNTRTVTLTGGISGTATFDGTTDLTINTTVVDGSGSGLNADMLDGHDASYFSISTHNHDVVYYPRTTVDTLLNAKLGDTETSVASSKLETARTITFNGDVTGSYTFDGAADKSVTLTVAELPPNRYTVVATNGSILSNMKYIAYAGVVLTLPTTPTIGDFIEIACGGDWESSNMTIQNNGQKILGVLDNLVCDTNQGFTLIYLDASHGWMIQ